MLKSIIATKVSSQHYMYYIKSNLESKMLFSGKCCLCIKLTFPNIRKVWVTGFAYFFETTYISVCKEGNRVDFR